MKILAENDKLIRRTMLATTVATFLLLTLPAIFWVRLPEEIPLFYSLPWGESQIVNKGLLFILGAVSFLFMAVNLFLSRTIDGDVFLRRLLWAGGGIASGLALITLVRIIFLF